MVVLKVLKRMLLESKWVPRTSFTAHRGGHCEPIGQETQGWDHLLLDVIGLSPAVLTKSSGTTGARCKRRLQQLQQTAKEKQVRNRPIEGFLGAVLRDQSLRSLPVPCYTLCLHTECQKELVAEWQMQALAVSYA